jgi:hypothetical protein
VTNAEYADGLRRLANILEANPMMAQPSQTTNLFISCFDKETFAATVKAFGQGTKEDGGDTINFVPVFPLPIKVFGHKAWICERRVVKRHVARQVIPAEPARPEQVIEEHDVDDVEYGCGPILATAADIAEALEVQP